MPIKTQPLTDNPDCSEALHAEQLGIATLPFTQILGLFKEGLWQRLSPP